MDPQHTFLRVHAWLSRMLAQLLTPRNRSSLEYASLRVPIVLLGVLTVMHVNFVAQLGYANEFPGSTIDESQLVQIKVCEDRGLLDKKDEGRQDDEMMQNQGTRPNPNPSQKAGFVYKVKEKLPGCQTQTQTGQTQYKVKEMLPGCQTQSQTGQTQPGNSQTRSQTETDQCKTGFHGLFDKKDEGRQDNEMMQNQATRYNPNPSQKAGLVFKVKETLPGCQIQTQTGQTQTQTQTGKTQITQIQTQTQTQIQIQTGQTQTQTQTGQTQTQIQTQTQTQTVQCKTGMVDKK